MDQLPQNLPVSKEVLPSDDFLLPLSPAEVQWIKTNCEMIPYLPTCEGSAFEKEFKDAVKGGSNNLNKLCVTCWQYVPKSFQTSSKHAGKTCIFVNQHHIPREHEYFRALAECGLTRTVDEVDETTGKILKRTFFIPKLRPPGPPQPIKGFLKSEEFIQKESPSPQVDIGPELYKISAETQDKKSKRQIEQMEVINKKFKEKLDASNHKMQIEKVGEEHKIDESFQETRITIETSYATRTQHLENQLSVQKRTLLETLSKTSIKTEIETQKKRCEADEKGDAMMEKLFSLYFAYLSDAEMKAVLEDPESLKIKMRQLIEEGYAGKLQTKTDSLKKTQNRPKSF